MGKTICVIGAGLAGGIVASKLAQAQHSVTLLELGNTPTPLLPADELWTEAAPKAAFTRGQGIGGTSNFWHGGLTVLDKTDVEGVEGCLPHPKSPLSHADLRHYSERALALLRGQHDSSLREMESPTDQQGQEFPIHGEIFRFKGLLYPTTPFSTRPLIESARQQHGLEVIKGFAVQRILLSDGGGRAVAVEGLEGQEQTPRKIQADLFILCAGGIGSPKILLDSAQPHPRLRNLPIGQNLIDHPTGFVFKAKLRRRMNLKQLFGQPGPGFRRQCGFVLKADCLSLANFRNHILFLRPAISMKDPLVYDFLKRKLVAYKGQNLRSTDIAYLLRHTDLLFDAVNFKFGILHSTRYVSGLTFTEQFPNDQNRIFRPDPDRFAIQWDISHDDSQSIEQFLKVFSDCHSHLFEQVIVFPNIRRRLETAGHHSGGCRMASNPADGVVDQGLRVFGVENLWVADGSVLGFSGSANTGLTIAALALKCCDTVGNG